MIPTNDTKTALRVMDAVMRSLEERGYVVMQRPPVIKSRCCMLMPNGNICTLPRMHAGVHKQVAGD